MDQHACQGPARACADGPVRRHPTPRARVSTQYTGREPRPVARLPLFQSAPGDRDPVVPLALFARSKQTGAAAIVAVHQVFAPALSTDSRSLTRAWSQSCVSRSALSLADAPKDIRANTDDRCQLRPRPERLDAKCHPPPAIVVPSTAVFSLIFAGLRIGPRSDHGRCATIPRRHGQWTPLRLQ